MPSLHAPIRPRWDRLGRLSESKLSKASARLGSLYNMKVLSPWGAVPQTVVCWPEPTLSTSFQPLILWPHVGSLDGPQCEYLPWKWASAARQGLFFFGYLFVCFPENWSTKSTLDFSNTSQPHMSRKGDREGRRPVKKLLK